MSIRRAAPLTPEARRASIIAATIPLLRIHGRAVTTAQIALAAGVAEGTLFRAFPDKDSLIQAAIETAFDPEPTVRQLAAIDDKLPLRDKLLATVQVLDRRVAESWQIFSMVGFPIPRAMTPGSPPPLDPTVPVIIELIEPHRDELRCDPPHAARLLRMMTFAGTHPRITDGAPLTAGEIVSVLLEGIQRRPDDADAVDAAEDADDHARPPSPALHAPCAPDTSTEGSSSC